VAGYTTPGQYVQMRTAEDGKAAFIAVANAPGEGGSTLEFLIKPVEGTAGDIATLPAGATLDMSAVMGKGFDLSKADKASDILIFATGSGISPIRALLEADAEHGGLEAIKRDSVRLYYGAQDKAKMAFTDRFKAWEASGVTVVPVFSQGADGKYVQAQFTDEGLQPPAEKTFVVLCGQKGMSEGVEEAMTAVGISKEQFLTNF